MVERLQSCGGRGTWVMLSDSSARMRRRASAKFARSSWVTAAGWEAGGDGIMNDLLRLGWLLGTWK